MLPFKEYFGSGLKKKLISKWHIKSIISRHPATKALKL